MKFFSIVIKVRSTGLKLLAITMQYLTLTNPYAILLTSTDFPN